MAVRAEDIAPGGRVDLDRDRLLVVRHQRGEDDAFDELYRRYHHRLVTFCERRVGDRHTAEELAQESFVRALRALPSFAGERHFYPWMTVIARRLCIDHHRRSSRVSPAAEIDTGSVDADHDALWEAVDLHHLALAMERLAPRHQEILELREHRGWSYQQIADHLAVPITTIEALLHRARKALRREYAAVAGDDGGRRFGIAAAVAAAAAKVRTLIAGSAADRWIPGLAAAAAAAGVGAGLVLVPSHAGPAPTADAVVVTAVASTPAAAPATAPATAPAPAGAPVVVTQEAPPAPSASATVEVEAPPRPEPAAQVGPVGVFADPAGQAYVDQQVDDMPVVLDVAVARVGLDPANLLGPAADPEPTTPGGTP